MAGQPFCHRVKENTKGKDTSRKKMLSDNDVPRPLLKKGNKHAYRNSPSKKIRLELKYPNLQKQKVEFSKSKAAKCIYDLKPHTFRNKKTVVSWLRTKPDTTVFYSIVILRTFQRTYFKSVADSFLSPDRRSLILQTLCYRDSSIRFNTTVAEISRLAASGITND